MSKSSKKTIKKELKYFMGIILLAIIICSIVMAIYFGVRLIINPTDVIVIEKGELLEEESSTRLCD